MFEVEKETDAEAECHAALAVALMQMHRLDEAVKEMNLATQAVANSHNVRTLLNVSDSAARVLTAVKQYARAKQKVDAALAMAENPGNVPYLLDLRLERCELEEKMGSPLATSCFTALRQQATKQGFQLIARRASERIH